ncbi:hypothetical protein [Thermocoleostomius sinensis]|uniref:Uncharacterized protein n=1 Tax=Thermocoleostomius sinensis A174 TaxID=2016057 RepID=A0A9E9C4F8_9CYAN|nr:hypothetical protein [Thermocoleostomius sinensis]WAL60001.1 hypothetical protein OXH18_22975 [Thermocoleostomius sinensis A174]
MNITLELPSELERELANEASQLNLPLAEYILRVLSFRPFLQNPPKTGVELVTYWESIGVVSSRTDITDSQEYARRLRDQAEHRERA